MRMIMSCNLIDSHAAALICSLVGAGKNETAMKKQWPAVTHEGGIPRIGPKGGGATATPNRSDRMFLEMCRVAAHHLRRQRAIDLETLLQATAPEKIERVSDRPANQRRAAAKALSSVRWLLRLAQFSRPEPLRLYTRGSTEVSLDEAWLISLLKAQRRADAASVSFLIRSRCAPDAARWFRTHASALLEHIQSCLPNVKCSRWIQETDREPTCN